MTVHPGACAPASALGQCEEGRSALRRDRGHQRQTDDEVAAEFEAIHDIERAQKMGSVDAIIAPQDLRPYLVDALERGIARELQRISAQRQAHPAV